MNGPRQADKVEKAALPVSPEKTRQQRLDEMKQLAEIMAEIYTDILGEPKNTDSSMMAEEQAA